MANSTLASLTAATAGAGGLFYGTQSGADRKFTLTAAGAALVEAANAAAQLSSLGAAGLAGNTFTGAQVLNSTALGTTATPQLSLVNTTAATNGSQQGSPGFVLQGNGFKTNATAASQTVAFQQHVLPIQGAANPTGALVFSSNINGAGVSELLRLDSNAGLAWGSSTSNGCMTGALGAGGMLIGRTLNANPATLAGYTAFVGDYNGHTMTMRSDGTIGFNQSTGSLWIGPTGGSFWKYGGTPGAIVQGEASATPVNQVYKGPNGSGTNIGGGKLCLAPGQSTGSATPAILALQGTSAGSSGTTAQTLVDVLSIIRAGVVRITGIPTSSAGLSTGDIWSDGGTLKIV